MPQYRISIEYERGDGTNIERSRLEPLIVEAEGFAEAISHFQVIEALNRLDAKLLDKVTDSLPPEVAAEAAASLLPLYSVQICGAVYNEV